MNWISSSEKSCANFSPSVALAVILPASTRQSSSSNAKVTVTLKAAASPSTRNGFLRSRNLSHFSLQNFLRSEEHTSELQSLMRISYAVFCLKKQRKGKHIHKPHTTSSPASNQIQTLTRIQTAPKQNT